MRFTIQACSGEVSALERQHGELVDQKDASTASELCTCALSVQDTDYPVRELLYHSPQTRGWQSPRCGSLGRGL